VEFLGARKIKKEGLFFGFWKVGSSMSGARTVDAVLWENSDLFH